MNIIKATQTSFQIFNSNIFLKLASLTFILLFQTAGRIKCVEDTPPVFKYDIKENELFNLLRDVYFNEFDNRYQDVYANVTKNINSPSAENNRISGSLLLNLDTKQIVRNEFDFNEEIRALTILNGGFDTTWALLKYNERSNKLLGLDFNRKSNELKQTQKSLPEISDIFCSPYDHNFVILNDIQNNLMLISYDNLQTKVELKVPFKPESIYFTKDSNVLFASEDNNKNFFVSIDSGNNWFLLATNLTLLPKWNKEKTVDLVYFINEKQFLVEFNVLKFKESEKKSVNDHLKTVENVSNVKDFDIYSDNTMFIKIQKDNTVELIKRWLKKTKRNFTWTITVASLTPRVQRIKDIEILSKSSNQMMIRVKYERDNDIKNDLYHSSDLANFEMTLTNIATKSVDKKIASEFQSLNVLGGVYIANSFSNSENIKKTYIKNSKNEWSAIVFDDFSYKEFSLDLTHNFYFSYEDKPSLPVNLNAPDFMIATALNKDASKSIVCVYDVNESKWKKVLDGEYLYSTGDNGRVIIAVSTKTIVNKFIYSFDHGNTWQTYKFSNKLLIVDDLTLDSLQSSSPLFSLYATNVFTKTKMLFKFNFEKLINSYENKEELETKPIHQTDSQIKLDCNETCISRTKFEEVCKSKTSNCIVSDFMSATNINKQDAETYCNAKCISAKNPSTFICISNDLKCNGVIDCENGMDELNECSYFDYSHIGNSSLITILVNILRFYLLPIIIAMAIVLLVATILIYFAYKLFKAPRVVKSKRTKYSPLSYLKSFNLVSKYAYSKANDNESLVKHMDVNKSVENQIYLLNA